MLVSGAIREPVPGTGTEGTVSPLCANYCQYLMPAHAVCHMAAGSCLECPRTCHPPVIGPSSGSPPEPACQRSRQDAELTHLEHPGKKRVQEQGAPAADDGGEEPIGRPAVQQ